jgi:hypothetical protein
MRIARLLACLLAAVAGAVGCADPYADDHRRPREPGPAGQGTVAPTTAQREAEAGATRPTGASPGQAGDALPPRRAPAEPLPGGKPAADPRALARTFAERSLNWSWRDPEAPYRALAALATGPLRRELARARAAVRRDETIARDRLGSRGRFVAVDVQGGGSMRRLVVVVAEEALIDGRGALEGPRHRVYAGEARRSGAGWGMGRWAPLP